MYIYSDSVFKCYSKVPALYLDIFFSCLFIPFLLYKGDRNIEYVYFVLRYIFVQIFVTSYFTNYDFYL